jgi:hypothetical protein
LPAAARGQAEQVRQAVTESLDDLMDHARRTAEETQAIDEAFQGRVRRNYEMLSEAVRLMGAVAGTPNPPPPMASYRERPARAAPTPAAPAVVVAPEPEPAPEPELELRAEAAAEPAPQSRAKAAPVPAPAPQAELKAEPQSQAEPDDDLELNVPMTPARRFRSEVRPRLRLTPTATDAEFSNVFEQAGGRIEEAPTGEAWTWKDLLSSIDESDHAEGNPPLEEALAAEIGAMGIDPAALLPRSRIHEIAAAIQARDTEGAREVVRKLAPAASRRLARRLFTDEVLKRQVVTYLGRYHGLLQDATDRDHEGFLVETLLTSEAGRAYLLFDAAAGDLT